MLIEGPWLSYPISVDVVATFEFNSEFWPQGKFRRPPNNEVGIPILSLLHKDTGLTFGFVLLNC